jgi:glycolate oxidase iron-sulfur subunit
MRMLRVAQRTGMLWLARQTPLGKLVPPRKRTMAGLLAKKIPARPASAMLDERYPAIGEKRMTVAVMLGCVNDHMFADANVAMVRVLRRMGAEVIVPQVHACCGAIHHHMGDHASSHQMAVDNCARFADMNVDAIAVNAAGCGSWIKSYPRALPDNDIVQQVGPKFRDIHEILWQLLEMNPALKEQWVWPDGETTYTYQDACHLVHGQGISDTPRKLLASIKGLRYVALAESDRCCGSAGTYNICQPEMAAQIQSRKIDHILATGARIVAVGNPGCTLQILAGLRDAGRRGIRCCYPVELIDRSWADR